MAIHVDGVTTMLELAGEWSVDLERGPDWLFIRVHCPEDGKAELRELHIQCGGPASTALVALARLGTASAFLAWAMT